MSDIERISGTKLSLFNTANSREVIALYTSVFAASGGEAEGQNIGDLVSNLITNTRPDDLIGCVATISDSIVGCIFFSRFTVPNGQLAFILSPVAIASNVQGRGIGQKLIAYGLDHLKSLDVELVFTYGDPAFYSKTGFFQISERLVQAPFVLSQPEGWLAQSLTNGPLQEMQGVTECIAALSDQKYW